MIAKMTAFVDGLNADITSLEGNRGPVSKYSLPAENLKGKLELVFDKSFYEGIACSLDSIGYKYVFVPLRACPCRWVLTSCCLRALYKSIDDVLGEAKPFSISGR
jgi:acetylornithine deacetylase